MNSNAIQDDGEEEFIPEELDEQEGQYEIPNMYQDQFENRQYLSESQINPQVSLLVFIYNSQSYRSDLYYVEFTETVVNSL
jgi:hypothetical protein